MPVDRNGIELTQPPLGTLNLKAYGGRPASPATRVMSLKAYVRSIEIEPLLIKSAPAPDPKPIMPTRVTVPGLFCCDVDPSLATTSDPRMLSQDTSCAGLTFTAHGRKNFQWLTPWRHVVTVEFEDGSQKSVTVKKVRHFLATGDPSWSVFKYWREGRYVDLETKGSYSWSGLRAAYLCDPTVVSFVTCASEPGEHALARRLLVQAW